MPTRSRDASLLTDFFIGIVFVFFGQSRVGTAAEPQVNRSSKTSPNVVVILADDLGWSDVGCYGADFHETPNLDRFAQSAVRFTDAYAASVCSPTRACLMTGRHYARLQMTIWREATQTPPQNRKLIPPIAVADLPLSEVTVAERFQRAGYITAAVGKWHLGDAAHYPETQGFDINIGGTIWGAPQTFFYPYRGSQRFDGEFRYVPHLEGGTTGEYLTDRLTDEALRVIDNAGDKPFFLYLAHHAPHTPIEAKAELVKRYEEKRRPNFRHQNAKYAAMVHSLDESVGRVLRRLEERNLTNRTIVVFLSDNGGHIGRFDNEVVTNNSPLRSGKGSLFEGGIRIPMIIRTPEVSAGVCHEPVFVGDLYPTLLSLSGLTGDADQNVKLDGNSLAPLLSDPSSHLNRESLYFHYPHYYPTTAPVSAIRSRDWKLIEFLEDNHVELYNLKNDLGEHHDESANRPDQVNELRRRLNAWRDEVHAPMPVANANFKS